MLSLIIVSAALLAFLMYNIYLLTEEYYPADYSMVLEAEPQPSFLDLMSDLDNAITERTAEVPLDVDESWLMFA